MTWLLYVRGLRATEPQIIYDGLQAPVIGEGIRGLVIPGSVRRLTREEDALLRVDRLSLAELQRRYPPPGGTDDRAPDPTPPKSPAPIAPDPAGVEKRLEVA